MEVWGPNVRPDEYDNFFNHILATNGLIDIEITKIFPT